MAAKSILDADMATLWRWVRAGLSWWADELRAMSPGMLRNGTRGFAQFAMYHGPGRIEVNGRGKSLPVLLDPELCMIRTLKFPVLSESDLRKLVQLDAERLFPLPAAQMVIEVKVDPGDRTAVTVAGIPRARAAAMLEELAQFPLDAARIAMADPDRPGVPLLDFGRSLAEAGLIKPARPVAAIWWAVAGFLFLLNLSVFVWRDIHQLDRLEQVIADQAPAVRAARVISGRIAATGAQAQLLAERRARQNAGAVLAGLTDALPDQAWVQRYSWDGRTIRISGYKRQGVDVIGALRKSPWFADVRAANAEAIAEVPSGQPFDITATVRAGAG